MILSSNDLQKLCDLAIKAALSAGRVILDHLHQDNAIQFKDSGSSAASQVVTHVDHLCQDVILIELRSTLDKYKLGLLTEEIPDDKSRLQKDYFWCIDPLDGTLPFTKKQSGFAVSIALVSRQGLPQIGVIYDPWEKNLYHAIIGRGLYKNEKKWNSSIRSSVNEKNKKIFTWVINRSFLNHSKFVQCKKEIHQLSKQRGHSDVRIIQHGGGAMNACWVLENSPACYFGFPKKEDGGGSLWDYAASACLFKEAGYWVSDINGTPLELNRSDSTFMNHRGILYASGENLAQEIMMVYNQINSQD